MKRLKLWLRHNSGLNEEREEKSRKEKKNSGEKEETHFKRWTWGSLSSLLNRKLARNDLSVGERAKSDAARECTPRRGRVHFGMQIPPPLCAPPRKFSPRETCPASRLVYFDLFPADASPLHRVPYNCEQFHFLSQLLPPTILSFLPLFFLASFVSLLIFLDEIFKSIHTNTFFKFRFNSK